MDEDGFLTITDRLSRFSKIGGEMVPHVKIEEEYHRGLGAHERVVAVTSVPSEKKGEELVVLYEQSKCSVDELRGIIDRSELENLFRPKADKYVGVEAIPVLGSGKLDIMGIRRVAVERIRESEPEGRFAESDQGRGR
jgi:acyl-[acyl-carrier-protein]-phospholipid O-acyltransferase/long-chain-fatty-acid--[acyl-carrier-protein] ligase